jgi:predicted DNA-binding protein
MGEVDVVTVKVPRELKKRMKQVDMNWSQYIRECIEKKIDEQRIREASRRLDDIRGRGEQVPTKELVSWIREERER